MTQSQAWSELNDAEPHRPGPSSDSDLVRLICDEFEPARLTRTLDIRGEHVDERHWISSLSGPLQEVLGREGKYFRSRLVQVAYALSAGTTATVMPQQLPLLVEVLHAGSLIVDDIEDDSKNRRGRPALHTLVGLPLALNAGNWLYFLPHRLLEELTLDATRELELRRAIDCCVLRCHYGQALDLGVRLSSLAQSEVFDLVSLSTRLKTSTLLELAADVGVTAAGGGPELRAALSAFARSYGVALQMLDDTSGLYRQARADKGHEDLLNDRLTWPWAWLSQRLDELTYSRLQHQARAVERRELHPELLAAALRRHLGDSPHRIIHRQLTSAFERLERQVNSSDLLEPLVEEIERLESAYG